MTNQSSDITIEQLDSLQKEAKNLFIKKNTNYNNKLSTQGTIRNIVRINDRINELESITINQDIKMRETLLGLLNSVTMRIMLLDKNSNIENYVDSISFNKNIINKWTIQGSSGNIYTRENITYPDGRILRSCTCPSYKYSTNESKYCKHTKNGN